MKPMRVKAIRNLKGKFTKSKEYELNEHGIKNDDGHTYKNFLDYTGDTYLEKWNKFWTFDDYHDLFVEVETTMELKDLKNGMVVETREGRRYLVIGDRFVGNDTYLFKSYYDNRLNMFMAGHEFDVVKVYNVPKKLGALKDLQTCKLDLLWEADCDNQRAIGELVGIISEATDIIIDSMGKIKELEGNEKRCLPTCTASKQREDARIAGSVTYVR